MSEAHEHVWGPWLVGPYFPDAIVRRCACGAEDRQEVDDGPVEEPSA